MASRLQTLIAVFKTALNDPTISIATGRKALATNSSPPRIVYVYSGGPILDPDLVGAGLLDLEDGGTSRSRIIRVRHTTLSVSMHGRTEEEAETLLHLTTATWEAIASGSVSFDNEAWPEQEEGQDSHEERGSRVTLDITVNIPIYADIKPLIRPKGLIMQTDLITQSMYGPTNTYGSGTYRPADSITIP